MSEDIQKETERLEEALLSEEPELTQEETAALVEEPVADIEELLKPVFPVEGETPAEEISPACEEAPQELEEEPYQEAAEDSEEYYVDEYDDRPKRASVWFMLPFLLAGAVGLAFVIWRFIKVFPWVMQ